LTAAERRKRTKRRMKKAKEVDSGGEEEEDEEEEEATKKEKKPKRKRVALPEYTERPESSTSSASFKDSPSVSSSSSPFRPARENQPWTEEDLSKLSKAMARFPVGTLNRWEKVAEFVERTVNEILTKNKEIRDSQFHRLNQAVSGADSPEDNKSLKKNKKSAQAMAALTSDVTKREETDDVGVVVASTTTSTAAAASSSAASASTSSSTTLVKEEKSQDDGGWSQNQQKIFEWALAQYPKGTAERWDKIAQHIPGKNKSDCVARFKFIVESLKQKKTAAV